MTHQNAQPLGPFLAQQYTGSRWVQLWCLACDPKKIFASECATLPFFSLFDGFCVLGHDPPGFMAIMAFTANGNVPKPYDNNGFGIFVFMANTNNPKILQNNVFY